MFVPPAGRSCLQVGGADATSRSASKRERSKRIPRTVASPWLSARISQSATRGGLDAGHGAELKGDVAGGRAKVPGPHATDSQETCSPKTRDGQEARGDQTPREGLRQPALARGDSSDHSRRLRPLV